MEWPFPSTTSAPVVTAQSSGAVISTGDASISRYEQGRKILVNAVWIYGVGLFGSWVKKFM